MTTRCSVSSRTAKYKRRSPRHCRQERHNVWSASRVGRGHEEDPRFSSRKRGGEGGINHDPPPPHRPLHIRERNPAVELKHPLLVPSIASDATSASTSGDPAPHGGAPANAAAQHPTTVVRAAPPGEVAPTPLPPPSRASPPLWSSTNQHCGGGLLRSASRSPGAHGVAIRMNSRRFC